MKNFLPALLTLLCVSCGQTESPHSTLRVPVSSDPATIDPRHARDLISMSVVKMLYDGLTRIGPDGTPTLSLAKSLDLDETGTCYTFHLRQACWSNGDPITSFDFARSWSEVLDPANACETASFLECMESFFCPDEQTLVIHLKRPTAYFLELTSLAPYYPHRGSSYSGPFILKEWQPNASLELVRNPHYWEETALDGLELQIVPDEMTALYLFEQGELDWAGSPLSRLPDESVRAGHALHAPLAATSWYKLNVDRPPLDDQRMRRALALAIDREQICNHVIANHPKPALGPAPQLCAQEMQGDAAALFEEMLAERGWTRETMPSLTLSYVNSEQAHLLAQAIQQQWREILGLDIAIEAMEFKTFLNRISHRDYCIASKNWLADFDDPINFLGLFKERTGSFNETGWECAAYRDLLDLAEATVDPEERFELLRAANNLFATEMPAIPLFHNQYSYLQGDVAGVVLPAAGAPDFKWASR